MRRRTILDPRVNLNERVGGITYRRPIRLTDYISVPAIDTYGTWAVLDLVPPEQLAALKQFTNSLPKEPAWATR